MSKSSPRYIAAQIINAVIDGQSLSTLLEKQSAHIKNPQDKAFVQAIVFGVCRFYTRLDIILSHLLEKPMKAKDSDVYALLLVGLYQLIYMRVPKHAAVSETVAAAEALKKPWARGLVNAILRNFLRKEAEVMAKLTDDEEAQYSHDAWWIKKIKKAWPGHWQAILNANNEHPPFSLRAAKNRDAYLQALAAQQIAATPIVETEQGLMLTEPIPVQDLPGFFKGEVSVQDGGAQLAAELMELSPGLSVLDTCAAPGGKLIHLLQREPQLGHVIALEKDPTRLTSIQENLRRTQLKADCIATDATDLKNWWDGKTLFDRILLDVPCSASGVIRRHPDIKLLRRESDLFALNKQQTNLLTRLWPLLKPGGLLLYATCSIFPEENTAVLKTFLAQQADAQEEKIVATWGLPTEIGRQVLPGMHGMDGFYYAKIRKV